MTIKRAICRLPSEFMGDCELTHLEREPIDPARIAREHARYVQLLGELGYEVQELESEPDLPDSVFVEDAAVVLDEVAVITRPGAPSRRPETASISAALAPWRKLLSIEPPGTLDGGDVFRLGRTIFVGLSSRSNRTGVEQLARGLAPFGYRVQEVSVRGCLHLKSAACPIADDTLLVQEEWVDPVEFGGAHIVPVAEGELGAANVVWLGQDVIYPAVFPATASKLVDHGLRVHTLDYSELAKAEGGVTCCSLLFNAI